MRFTLFASPGTPAARRAALVRSIISSATAVALRVGAPGTGLVAGRLGRDAVLVEAGAGALAQAAASATIGSTTRCSRRGEGERFMNDRVRLTLMCRWRWIRTVPAPW